MNRLVASLLASALIVSCADNGPKSDTPYSATTDATNAPAATDSSVAGQTTPPPSTQLPIATLPADQIAALVAARPYNFIYARPEGTTNREGRQFWNATDACCGGGSTVDDSTYLRAVIHDVKNKLAVDEKQVYIVGHSNGGFMAHRMACDHAETIAAIVSIAGATYLNTADCTPTEPVSVLQVHGTADTVIAIDGGTFMEPHAYPSALQTVEAWSAYNACTAGAAVSFDLDPLFAEDEAIILPFTECSGNTDVALWTIIDQGHGPLVTRLLPTVLEFLFGHPKA